MLRPDYQYAPKLIVAIASHFLAQVAYFGSLIGEISCPTRYFEAAPSIDFRRSIVYGFCVLRTSIVYRLARGGIIISRIFASDGRRLST